ncbi:MAG: nicotinamide-nucleotide amidohydrolase family protein [Clostridiaceae bacterium]|nr:nicotinamide-nucleotide amidohydrolase family protein [Clostridiaceae bacterium]
MKSEIISAVTGEIPLEFLIGETLIKKNLTIATAESCTGGLLAATLINYPGISSVFLEGVVTYTNEAKVKRIGVRSDTLEKFGAVSHETAGEMARGVALSSGTDIGISTTGIAGPGGGTKEKPVGLVYIGICIKGRVKTQKLQLTGSRECVRNRAVIEALNLLRLELQEG